jgi:hypothetical protein
MRNSVVSGVWFNLKNRVDEYINVLKTYYSDCDHYIGINPCSEQEYLIERLNQSNLIFTYGIVPDHLIIKQHTSSTQLGIKLLIDSKKEYNITHFLHSKGSSYNDYHYGRAFNEYIVEYSMKKKAIEQFLDNNLNYGAFADYGGIQMQWFIREGINKSDLKRPFENVTDTAASNLLNYKKPLEVHTNLDLGEFYNFKYMPLRTQFLVGVYSFKFFIIKEFFEATYKDILERNLITDLKFDIYFFETHIAQLSCRMGYLRKINNYWNISFGDKELEQTVIDLYKTENNL